MEGRGEGRKEGRKKGRKEGRKQGRKEGRKDGRTDGRKHQATKGTHVARKDGKNIPCNFLSKLYRLER